MNEVYLLTGGNMGDRLNLLLLALERIEKQVGIVTKKSAIYETAAWGVTNQNSFLNQVLLVNTALPAEVLLQIILQIELELGRKRIEKMGPRTVDIDILFYGSDIISSPNLIIPHPQIANRRFVLTPLNEITPDFIHPVLQKTISELLKLCQDQLDVKKYVSKNSFGDFEEKVT